MIAKILGLAIISSTMLLSFGVFDHADALYKHGKRR